MKVFIPAIAVALFTVACSSNPAAPAPTCTDRGASNFGGPLPCTYPPPIPACQLHHTGVLILQNKAANLRPRNVWVDGANSGTIAWGGELSLTVTAGVSHAVYFTDSGTGQVVTSTAYPNVVECSTYTLFTSFNVDR